MVIFAKNGDEIVVNGELNWMIIVIGEFHGDSIR